MLALFLEINLIENYPVYILLYIIYYFNLFILKKKKKYVGIWKPFTKNASRYISHGCVEIIPNIVIKKINFIIC